MWCSSSRRVFSSSSRELLSLTATRVLMPSFRCFYGGVFKLQVVFELLLEILSDVDFEMENWRVEKFPLQTAAD
jgi:hypothetical protein